MKLPYKASIATLFLTLCLSASSAGVQEAEAQQYSEAGQKALANGNYVEAQHAYEKLRDLEPGIAEVHANLGLIYFEEGKFGQAIAPLQHALKLKPNLAKTDALLAMALSEVGRYREGLPGLEKCFGGSLDPEMKRLCGLHLERVYSSLQQDSNAVQVALEMNRLYSDDPEVLYHNGKIFGNFAFLSMQKLAQVAPDSVWRHQAMAEVYESQGSYDTAIGEYRQVLARDPNRVGIHYRLGRTLLSRSQQSASAEDLVAALKEFHLELELVPSNANAAYEIAEADRTAGQLEEAEDFFELALKSHPDFEEAHLGLASVLASLQKPAEALPHLQKAISLNRHSEVGWYRLSRVQGMLGNVSEQQKAFTEFQRLRNEKSSSKEEASPGEVTRQQVEPNATKQ